MNNTIEKISTVKTTALFSKDMKSRYCLKMEWDPGKKSCAILMTYPSTADELMLDQTTMLVRNGAVNQDFGSIAILNVFSLLDAEHPKSDRVNSSVVMKACSEADMILIAYGRSKAHFEAKEDMLKLLQEYKDKLYTIKDKNNAVFSHPLSPMAREWHIVKYDGSST